MSKAQTKMPLPFPHGIKHGKSHVTILVSSSSSKEWFSPVEWQITSLAEKAFQINTTLSFKNKELCYRANFSLLIICDRFTGVSSIILVDGHR